MVDRVVGVETAAANPWILDFGFFLETRDERFDDEVCVLLSAVT